MNIHEYSVACVTSLESSKNPSAIAREIGVNQSSVSRFLQKTECNNIDFIPIIASLFGKKKLNVILDDTVISRRYAEHSEGTSSMIDQSTKTFTNGYKIVAAGLTDGKYFLPVAFEQWIAKFILKDTYRKTTEIAQSLVSKLLMFNVNIGCFVMDGLYFSVKFLLWLHQNKINFVAKAKTTTRVIYNGESVQLQHCKGLRLNSNQNSKTIMAEWNGAVWYFVAVRRSGKHGPKIIYLIANFKTKSSLYSKIYDTRWIIEKCFRTSKQHLGLKNSFSQYAHTYLAHIKCSLFAYALMQLVMKKFRLHSTEEAIRKTQALKCKTNPRILVQQISLLAGYA